MSHRCVLIIGDPDDPHVLRVSQHLAVLGASTLILNRLSASNTFALAYNQHGLRCLFGLGDRNVNSEAVASVWWRLKPLNITFSPGSEADIAYNFANAEWRHALTALPILLGHARWINEVSAQSNTALKPVQLLLAQAVGLRIPRTIIGNDPAAALELFEAGKVIYKTLTNHVFPTNEYIFTTEITADMVHQDAARIQRAPGIFQELLAKDHELRVTVVGDRIFTTRVNSQRHVATSVDWRRMQVAEGLYEQTILQEDTASKLLQFHARAGLHYAAYDFIVPRDGGEPIFLECNPAGQWLWLEDATHTSISQALASDLASAVETA